MTHAVGFYWTLPVPWAGFQSLPDDVEVAAALSRTIRYQMIRVRQHAKENHLTLIKEAVFLEIDPDRGSSQIGRALRQVAATCRARDAVLLLVDFARVQNWRGNTPLQRACARLGLRVEMLWPEEVMIDGRLFDPAAHFADWRARQTAWTDGRAARLAAARARAATLRAQGMTFARLAAMLNAEGLKSATGRPWTAESLRKAMAPPATAD